MQNGLDNRKKRKQFFVMRFKSAVHVERWHSFSPLLSLFHRKCWCFSIYFLLSFPEFTVFIYDSVSDALLSSEGNDKKFSQHSNLLSLVTSESIKSVTRGLFIFDFSNFIFKKAYPHKRNFNANWPYHLCGIPLSELTVIEFTSWTCHSFFCCCCKNIT